MTNISLRPPVRKWKGPNVRSEAYENLRFLLFESVTIEMLTDRDHDDRDAVAAQMIEDFPRALPALRRIQLHRYREGDVESRRVFDGLAGAYERAAAALTSVVSASEAAGAAGVAEGTKKPSSSSSFRGVCRDCETWSYSI